MEDLMIFTFAMSAALAAWLLFRAGVALLAHLRELARPWPPKYAPAPRGPATAPRVALWCTAVAVARRAVHIGRRARSVYATLIHLTQSAAFSRFCTEIISFIASNPRSASVWSRLVHDRGIPCSFRDTQLSQTLALLWARAHHIFGLSLRSAPWTATFFAVTVTAGMFVVPLGSTAAAAAVWAWLVRAAPL